VYAPFLIGYHDEYRRAELAAWLTARGIRATLTPVYERTPQTIYAAIRIDWEPADEIRHGDALREWAADYLIFPDPEDWAGEESDDLPQWTIRTGPE
jgi:hypothetical protein